ncbi:MAG TPA: orotidine-5'-phosphate decarboxylase [Candidatus Paceibacterota bacterium]|nr:orotidine-5'-phosphate decarboxylase [Candidatus Paceibacterota bacterium]
MIEERWSQGKFVCVGLDSDFDKIPESAHVARPVDLAVQRIIVSETIAEFNHSIVEATKDIVCAYKPNTAFYEAYGAEGIAALHRTITDIHAIAPDVPVILDAKRGDIGNTNKGYVKFTFDYLHADAVTVHPYLGIESLEPFLAKKDKGVFVLCRTSNPGAREFQDSSVYGEPLYRFVAGCVANRWNKNGNCGLVVGATYPEELNEIRGVAGDLPILIPGIGAQGGDLEKTVKAGRDSRGQGMIINSSRGIIFASRRNTFAEAARRETQKLHNLIDQYRNEA